MSLFSHLFGNKENLEFVKGNPVRTEFMERMQQHRAVMIPIN